MIITRNNLRGRLSWRHNLLLQLATFSHVELQMMMIIRTNQILNININLSGVFYELILFWIKIRLFLLEPG